MILATRICTGIAITALAVSVSTFGQTDSGMSGQPQTGTSQPGVSQGGASHPGISGLPQTETEQQADRNQQAMEKASAGRSSDQEFVKKAAEGGLAEVEFGQLAVQKANSDDVKKFGQRMVDDHSKANEQLKQVASSEGFTLPSSSNSKDKTEKERLQKLSGEQFDAAYMKLMLKDHKKDVAEFQHEAKNGKDSNVKDFASKTLPTLQEHLTLAQQIAPKYTNTTNKAGGAGE